MNRKLLAIADIKPFGLRIPIKGEHLKECLFCHSNSVALRDNISTAHFARKTCGSCGAVFNYTIGANEPDMVSVVLMNHMDNILKRLSPEDRAWLKLLLGSTPYPRDYYRDRKAP